MQYKNFTQEVLLQIQTISLNYIQYNNIIIINNSLTVILFSYEQLATQINITEIITPHIYIFENEWHKRKHILLNRIKSLLGYNIRLYARLCNCVCVKEEIALSFLQKNHLLGAIKTMYYYALIQRNEVVAVATFSHGRPMHRLPKGVLSYELVTYTSSTNLTIVGGLSKLLKAFIKEHQPGDIMTYVDALFTNVYNNSFTQLGFAFHSFTTPITFVINTKTHERNKYNIDKQLLTNEVCYTNKGNAKLVLRVSC